MAQVPATSLDQPDLLFARLAREIAIDHFDIETILGRYQVTPKLWEKIKTNPHFVRILESEISDWQGAGNTSERTRLKAASLIEQWLPEANALLHSKSEALPGKVQLGKLLASIAGMGLGGAEATTSAGDRFSVTINLGADSSLKFEKQVPPRVIDLAAQEINDV